MPETLSSEPPFPDRLIHIADRISAVPQTPGCYLYKDGEGRVIYVGKAKNLRRRVASYFQRGEAHPTRTLRLVQEVMDIEIIATDSEVEALLVENQLIKELQPRYNMRLKDDKTFPLLAITREEFPRVFVTRDAATEQVDLIGPFVSAKELRRAFHFLQRVFRFRVCDLDIHEGDAKRRTFTPCLNFHIKRCSAPCTLRIDRADYAEDMRALRAFLTGRSKGQVLESLRARMRAAAGELRFEDAARCRDQAAALDRLKQRGRLKDYDEPEAPTIDIHGGMEALRTHLGLSGPPTVIEGFDIAHLQGSHVVAALVQFVSGVPHKDGYRCFKVRGLDGDPGNDDFAAMREVVGRRYRRLVDEGSPLPDLVLIDGGHGQVAKAVEAIRAAGLEPGTPTLIGLAKREETVVRHDGYELRLSRRDPGLKLLQYVRDEAHRFCRRYFHLLQRNALEDGGSADGAVRTASPRRTRAKRRETP